MQITKSEIKYKDRLIKELALRIIPWILLSIIMIWMFYDKEDMKRTIIIAITQLIGLLVMIHTAFKWAKYQILNIHFSEENFKITFTEKNIVKEINSFENETFKIELDNHGWGIFPLDEKKKVNSLIIENENRKIKLSQSKSNSWKSNELHDLYYKGFHFHYNKYWFNKFDMKFKN